LTQHFTTERFTPAPDESRPPPVGEKVKAAGDGPSRFKLERWGEIKFDFDEEYLIDGTVPKQGGGLIYGASQTFKSFIVSHMALCVALGLPWAGRETERASVVYIAAEGAAGFRKRKAGYVKKWRENLSDDTDVDLAVISAAPNLGTGAGDFDRLVRTIEEAGIKPGQIIIDTAAKVIGGAEENGAGMARFLVNAEALV
jgi:RecA-family ATPase